MCFALAAHAAEPQWRPLWDGKSFAGWHRTGPGTWKIEQGALHGTHSRWAWTYGHLVTDRSYTNFSVRFQFKAAAGNSGFYFRADESDGRIMGIQVEIDPRRDTGGLYETGGRGWFLKPKPAEVARWFRPSEWNRAVIEANGPHLTIHVNGLKAVELNDPGGRRAGKFALQLHAFQEVDVWFKEIEISEP